MTTTTRGRTAGAAARWMWTMLIGAAVVPFLLHRMAPEPPSSAAPAPLVVLRAGSRLERGAPPPDRHRERPHRRWSSRLQRRRRRVRPLPPRLRLAFSSSKADPSRATLPFSAMGGTGRVELHGGLSAGQAGWSLSANVRLHRRTLHVWITARQVDAAGDFAVEDHRYEATVTDVPPGRYWLRVTHSYISWGQEGGMASMEVFDQAVLVRDGGVPEDGTSPA